MAQLSQLLERLAHITSYRDVQHLELSLLKTLDEILQPHTLDFIRVDGDDQPLQAFKYRSQLQEIEEQNLQAKSSRVMSLVQKALKHGQAAMRQTETGCLTAFPSAAVGEVRLCLLIGSQVSLTSKDTLLISSFFRIYHNFCQLLEDSQTDELTGLLNRKTFDENFQRISDELLQSEEGKEKPLAKERRQPVKLEAESYWMAVIDIDHFKKVNDTLGHIYGDEVLILLARLMRQIFRREDLLYRFGGEEFVVITRCGDLENARAVFERFRQTVANYAFPQLDQVTVSLGVVQVHSHVLAATLIDQADQALYYAKEHGRNQVCFYQKLLDAGQIKAPAPQNGTVDLF